MVLNLTYVGKVKEEYVLRKRGIDGIMVQESTNDAQSNEKCKNNGKYQNYSQHLGNSLPVQWTKHCVA